ncbi:MAG: PspC domain-containing protein [Terriglobales bacterium]
MYCNACGARLPADANHCQQCGRPVVANYRRHALERPRQGRKIAGVCLGIAAYLDIDVTLVRVLAVLSIFLGAGGLVAYVVAWILMPESPLPVPQTTPPASSLPSSPMAPG